MSGFNDRYLNFGDVYSIIMQAKTIDQAMNVLHLPYVEMPKWIPTSDRLPRLGENVLITVRGTVTIAMYFNHDVDFGNLAYWVSNDLDEDIEMNDVTAWMPLPEPYMEVSE